MLKLFDDDPMLRCLVKRGPLEQVFHREPSSMYYLLVSSAVMSHSEPPSFIAKSLTTISHNISNHCHPSLSHEWPSVSILNHHLGIIAHASEPLKLNHRFRTPPSGFHSTVSQEQWRLPVAQCCQVAQRGTAHQKPRGRSDRLRVGIDDSDGS